MAFWLVIHAFEELMKIQNSELLRAGHKTRMQMETFGHSQKDFSHVFCMPRTFSREISFRLHCAIIE